MDITFQVDDTPPWYQCACLLFQTTDRARWIVRLYPASTGSAATAQVEMSDRHVVRQRLVVIQQQLDHHSKRGRCRLANANVLPSRRHYYGVAGANAVIHHRWFQRILRRTETRSRRVQRCVTRSSKCYCPLACLWQVLSPACSTILFQASTDQERGIISWSPVHISQQTKSKTYNLPWISDKIERWKWARYIPISPTYEQPSLPQFRPLSMCRTNSQR